MNCLKALPVRTKHCADIRDEGYQSCTHYRDDGYSSCDKWDSKCCDWAPCSWFCKLITWFCVAWYWVSNLVCDAWEWVKNLVCVAWDVVTAYYCVIYTAVVAVVYNLVGRPHIGHTAPGLVTPEDAKSEVNREGASGNPYPHLHWWDSFVAFASTSVLKENGIYGWTPYLLNACATGKVIQAVWSSDGFYTVDIEMNAQYGDFRVGLPQRDLQDGIEKPRWMRAEIEIAEVGLHTPLPSVNQKVTICGPLFWDADGFLEIHPQGAADIQILGPA